MRGNALCSLSELRERYGPTPWETWRYKQLQHFVDTLPKPLWGVGRLNTWEKLVDQMGIDKHGISTIYNLLMTHLGRGAVCPTESWELELNQPLPDTISRILDFVHSTSVESQIKEINFKLLVKWYFVPAKLNKINSEESPLC